MIRMALARWLLRDAMIFVEPTSGKIALSFGWASGHPTFDLTLDEHIIEVLQRALRRDDRHQGRPVA